jgi:hypothetical protein
MVKLKEVLTKGKVKEKDQRKAKAEQSNSNAGKALELIVRQAKKKQPKAKSGTFGLLSAFGEALSEISTAPQQPSKPSKADKWRIE